MTEKGYSKTQKIIGSLESQLAACERLLTELEQDRDSWRKIAVVLADKAGTTT
jgi:hypothetical protein